MRSSGKTEFSSLDRQETCTQQGERPAPSHVASERRAEAQTTADHEASSLSTTLHGPWVLHLQVPLSSKCLRSNRTKDSKSALWN